MLYNLLNHEMPRLREAIRSQPAGEHAFGRLVASDGTKSQGREQWPDKPSGATRHASVWLLAEPELTPQIRKSDRTKPKMVMHKSLAFKGVKN